MKRTLTAVFVAALALAGSPASATSIGPGLRPFPTTDGDVLAATVLYLPGYRALAVGGNFRHIRGADGTLTAATNVAVLRIPDGQVLYAGKANSYVRSLFAVGGRLYLGGNFTSIDGKARNHAASVTAPGWQVTGFAAPGIGTVNTITAGGNSGIVLGASTSVRSVSPDTAAQRWSLPVTGGPVRALAVYPNQVPGYDLVYMGGLFEKVGSFTHHGLTRAWVNSAGAMIDTSFAPYFKPDSGIGDKGTWDGESPMSLAWQDPAYGDALMVGWGGAGSNGVRVLNPWTGGTWWSRQTDGDVQGIATVGDNVVAGWHRNHVSYSGTPFWYGGSLRGTNGEITWWDPQLVGWLPNTDGGNGGIQAFAYDNVDRILFAVGAFTGTGNCSIYTYPCTTAVNPRQSIAAYGVTG
jgi:hypothetical protein